MKSRKKRRIVRYRKPININIGTIILSLVFLYLGINCLIYITRDKISIYEVARGESEVVQGISTTGIALRSEKVTTTQTAGYINYYAKEGTKVSVGNTLYTIDENGDFSDMMESIAQNDATLTSDNIKEIKEDIQKFVISYDKKEFSNVYDFKYDLDTTLLESININSLDTINSALVANGGSALSINNANTSGIVEFYTDGFEGITPESITDEMFDKNNYKKDQITSGMSVETGKAVYKTIDNENWKLVIMLTDKQAEAYKDIDVVSVYFPTENIRTSAYFQIIQNGSSKYGVISLKRYMIQFCDSRFVEVQILADTVEGLKIPKSAVTQKDFYTIPVSYITNGGESLEQGFNRDILSNGEALVEFVPVEIVCKKDDLCYVAVDGELNSGDVLVKSETNERFTVGGMAPLNGVYNVNTGYTNFRYIDILSERNGYYIVLSGTTYGLQVYDQIVLDASLVKEKQVIFR